MYISAHRKSLARHFTAKLATNWKVHAVRAVAAVPVACRE